MYNKYINNNNQRKWVINLRGNEEENIKEVGDRETLEGVKGRGK